MTTNGKRKLEENLTLQELSVANLKKLQKDIAAELSVRDARSKDKAMAKLSDLEKAEMVFAALRKEHSKIKSGKNWKSAQTSKAIDKVASLDYASLFEVLGKIPNAFDLKSVDQQWVLAEVYG